MSKISSAFGCFADAAETDETNFKRYSTYTTKDEQLTVKELISILHTIVRKDPSAKDAPVFHIEFGALTPSTTVNVSEDKGLIISAGC
jgi:hypothetical protein